MVVSDRGLAERTFVRTGRPGKEPAVHGTTRLYSRGCRCVPCRTAHAAYQKRRRALLKMNAGDVLVSAELAREHLRWLSGRDVGKRAVGDVTGIAWQVIGRIANGQQRRIRRSTEEKIMRVTTDCRADRSEIDAAQTKRLIDDLRAHGYTLAELGRRLGYTREDLQFYRSKRITAINASRVERLHRVLMHERWDRERARLMEGARTPVPCDPVERMLELSARVA